jgi:hypothetical protein
MEGGLYTTRSTCLSASRTVYTRGFVKDGNFTAVHQVQKRPEDDVWIADGTGFIVSRERYQAHLKVAKEYKEVSLFISIDSMLTADRH